MASMVRNAAFSLLRHAKAGTIASVETSNPLAVLGATQVQVRWVYFVVFVKLKWSSGPKEKDRSFPSRKKKWYEKPTGWLTNQLQLLLLLLCQEYWQLDSRVLGKEVFVFDMNASIWYSFSPLWNGHRLRVRRLAGSWRDMVLFFVMRGE